jgi:hypothetical protein
MNKELEKLLEKPTASIPEVGKICLNMSRNAAYAAVRSTASGQAAFCTAIRGTAALLEGLRREHPGRDRGTTARAHTAALRQDAAPANSWTLFRPQRFASFGRSDRARPSNDGWQDWPPHVEVRP